MADLFYVNFTAYGVPHRIDFEFEEKARAFADDMVRSGFENVKVFDEFDPRRVADKPDGSADVYEIDPVYEPDPIPDLTVKFACKHIDAILDHQKTLTVRYDFSNEISEGDRITFTTPEGRAFATATIDKLSLMTARNFVSKKLAGHRTYTSVNNFLSEMENYYPDVPMEHTTRFDVVWYKEVTPLVG